jgi:predicted nucleic acid-binding protein
MLDSNIAIDAVAHREPFYQNARLLLMLGYISEIECWMSTTQLTDIAYVVSRAGFNASEYIRKLRQCIRITPFTETEFDSAMARPWSDLEDACVFGAALSIGAEAIITRNAKDFAASTIPVFNCEQLFDFVADTYGVNYTEVTLP